MNNQQRLQAALDLRIFVDEVRAAGELKEIAGAHWQLEIGALTELFAEQTPTPALLFDGIPDYPKGRRVLSNILFSPLRQAFALAMAPELRGIPLVQAVKARLAELKPLAPIVVANPPVMQNIIEGEDVNVCNFPAPHWHEKDGGRYIGTFDAVISRDPDSGYVNVGTYRVQAHDDKTVGLWIIPGKHGNLIAQKYWSQGQDCPFLIACGVPPSMLLASAVGIPWGVSEYDFLGGLLGAPVPIAIGKQTNLPMPANAELVLEGFAPPPEKVSTPRVRSVSGGLLCVGHGRSPVVKVSTVYHRNDPIITGDPPLKTYLNTDIYMYIRSANIWSAMERGGIPTSAASGFRAGRFIVAVAIAALRHARQAAGVLATRDGGRDTR